MLWLVRGGRECDGCFEPSLLGTTASNLRSMPPLSLDAGQWDGEWTRPEAQAGVGGTRRLHGATLTGPSRQPLMPTWKVTRLMCSNGGREDSHSHRSATVRPGTAWFLTSARPIDILTSFTCLIMESTSRSVLKFGDMECCCIRLRGEGRESVTVLCWRGAALVCCCVRPLGEGRWSVAVLC